jgi:putative oxidoreductase
MLPVENRGQPAVLFCFGFLYIAARGAGAFGLDRQRR